MKAKNTSETATVSSKRQAPLPVGQDWREFEPLDLLPSLQGALAVFPLKGYHGTTIRDLASAAGVTVPTLYYYHGDKQNMLVDLLSLGMEELLLRASKARASVPDDALSQFETLVEVAVLHMTCRQQLATLESEIRYLEPGNRDSYENMRRDFQQQVLEVVNRGIDDGVFMVDYPRDACRALLGMIQAVTVWYRPGGDSTPAQIAERYVEMSRRVVGAA